MEHEYSQEFVGELLDALKVASKSKQKKVWNVIACDSSIVKAIAAELYADDLKGIPLVHFGRSDELVDDDLVTTNPVKKHANEEWYGDTYMCQTCKNRSIIPYDNYCSACGLAIEWEQGD